MKRILIFLFILPMFLFGCINKKENGVPNNEVMKIDYFYYPSCESCNDGEAFIENFKYTVSDILDENDYEIEAKNIAVTEYLEEYQKIVDEIKTDLYFPNPPFLIINDNIRLIGQQDIDNNLRKTILNVLSSINNEYDLRNKMENNINSDDSYFIYFYKEDCPPCIETDFYFSKLDKIHYILGDNETKLKIQYIDANNNNNLKLMADIYDAYNVPKEERNVPIIFWKDGYLNGKDNIRQNIIDIINKGEAQNWPGLTKILK